MSQQPTEKRRKVIRFPALGYRAEVIRLGAFSRFAQPIAAEIIDYHCEGVGLCCERKFRVGSRLLLSIFSASERVSNIRGVVRYVRCRGNGYWLGVQFTDTRRGRKVDHSVLAGLEQLVKARCS